MQSKASRNSVPKAKAGIALVTGATSGMGRRMVEELLKRKYEVRAILKTHPNQTSEWRDLPMGVRVYAADMGLSDPDTKRTLSEACRGVGIIFHFAAITSNAKNYNEIINTNVVGTENLLRAYIDSNTNAGRLRLIYASSVTVYGYNRRGEKLTELSQPKPHSAYSESKYMAEEIVKAFAEANGKLEYTILRIGVIYGKGYEHSFMRIFKMLKEGRLVYVGDGANHLTLVHIDDVIAAMLIALDSKKGINSTYNLTDGVPYTQRELFMKAAKLLDAEEPSRSVHPLIARIGARTRGINMDQLNFLTSDRIVVIDKIKRELGFRPSVGIDKGGGMLADEFERKYKALK